MLEWTDEIDFVCLSKTYGVLSFHRSTQFRKLSFAVAIELSCQGKVELRERIEIQIQHRISFFVSVLASKGKRQNESNESLIELRLKENFLSSIKQASMRRRFVGNKHEIMFSVQLMTQSLNSSKSSFIFLLYQGKQLSTTTVNLMVLDLLDGTVVFSSPICVSTLRVLLNVHCVPSSEASWWNPCSRLTHCRKLHRWSHICQQSRYPSFRHHIHQQTAIIQTRCEVFFMMQTERKSFWLNIYTCFWKIVKDFCLSERKNKNSNFVCTKDWAILTAHTRWLQLTTYPLRM